MNFQYTPHLRHANSSEPAVPGVATVIVNLAHKIEVNGSEFTELHFMRCTLQVLILYTRPPC